MAEVEVIEVNPGDVSVIEIDLTDVEVVGVVGATPGVGQGTKKLDDLSDVDGADGGLIGQVLTKAADGQWRPAAPTGGGSVSGLAYEQLSPAASWAITHNLSRHPQVTVVDTAGARVLSDVVYTSDNALTVIHAEPLAGTAYLA